jgi:alpha-N-arabinofuranosidase
MASFTRIEEGETPSIVIHPTHKIAKINNNIYSGFTE